MDRIDEFGVFLFTSTAKHELISKLIDADGV
jgi:hypothetical protein